MDVGYVGSQCCQPVGLQSSFDVCVCREAEACL